MRRWSFAPAVLAVLLTACASAQLQPADRQAAPPPREIKSLTIGLSTPLDVIGIATGPSPVGGRGLLEEVHSNGLVTSAAQSRTLIGQLAERVPSLDDGSVEVLPDGRMRVTFHLRRGVVWHDGTPFTAHDLVFSHRIQVDPGLPLWRLDGVKEMESTEADDDHTFVVTYRRPYYRGTALGMRAFWPVPAHILGGPYQHYLDGGPSEEVANHPYWGSEYIHLGPFRMAQFKPGEEVVLEAHDRYFLGRPKLDLIRVRIFTDEDALLASIFGGAIEIVPELGLNPERGRVAKERWDATGEGAMHVVEGAPWMFIPQLRTEFQRERAVLDPRIRAGFYYALDREALSEAVNAGRRELGAWSLLSRSDELYEAAKDGMRQYPYDVERARAALRESGWIAGSDGALRHESDGRRFRSQLTAPPGRERALSAAAAYWREVGFEVEEAPMTAAAVRSIEIRSTFPGWQLRGAATGHGVLGVFEAPIAGPANHWVGNNWTGYENPRMQDLLEKLRTSPRDRDQVQTMRAISDLAAADLPLLMLYHDAFFLGARRGVKAFDDVAGGLGANPLYGGYGRNAHLWDVL